MKDSLNKRLQRQIWKHHKEPLPESVHELIEAISTSYDRYEQELELLNRIMDLSSEELFQANAELRKRNEELDRFVYSTSHDLRAPLTSILGILQLFKLTDDPEKIEEYLELIKTTTTNLDNFIQNIAVYTHNKKVDLQNSKVDVEKLIRDSIEKLSFMPNADAIEKTITVKCEAPFYSDPQRLANLFTNIISNSIKYFHPKRKKPFIKIDFHNDQERASITVEDNGIGIKEGHLEKIFDMFYRASYKSKGSGIGLYIVKEIVDKLSGEIEVFSNFNKGTTFRITLPNDNVTTSNDKKIEEISSN